MRVVKKEYEGSNKSKVKKENDKSYHNPCPRKKIAVRGGVGVSSKKKTSAVKKEPSHRVKTLVHNKKETQSQISNFLCDKCLCTYRTRYEKKYLKGEGNSLSVDGEVEILERDMVMRKGILSHFVPAQRFHTSMLDTKSHLPTASDVFRKEVLKIMSKPYDKEEHEKCREVMRVGSYLDHYPDLRRELVKYRYKRKKRLVILRGFLFWLQNVSHGVFRPWEDEECLAVELP